MSKQQNIYSVAIVFENVTPSEISNALRTIVLYAGNDDEALGAAYRLLSSEFNDDAGAWRMSMKVVMNITDFMANSEQKAHGSVATEAD